MANHARYTPLLGLIVVGPQMSRFVLPVPNLINAPPGWEQVDALLGAYRAPSTFGFVGSAGDLNRFWSRYRLAKSFRGIAVDHFVRDTVQGYSSLFRVFLVWSAFEHLMRITGKNLGTMADGLPHYSPDAFADAVRAVSDYDKFLSVVLAELDRKPHIDNLTSFLAGSTSNVLAVPAAIRHIFAHGKLTPSSGAGHVGAANSISALSCDFLFRVMDGEFIQRLRDNGVAV